MGLFSKKKEEEDTTLQIPSRKKDASEKDTPSLPKLPKLPDFSELEEEEEKISKLPSFPHNSLGSKFSQNTIKDAISGKEEGEEFPDADEFASEDSDEMRMMQEPLRKPFVEERGERFTPRLSQKKEGPVFVRIDNFEDALKVFNDTRKKLTEMESVLEEIRRIKEKEENELQSWENEINLIKGQIEKIDQDIFSKI